MSLGETDDAILNDVAYKILGRVLLGTSKLQSEKRGELYICECSFLFVLVFNSKYHKSFDFF